MSQRDRGHISKRPVEKKKGGNHWWERDAAQQLRGRPVRRQNKSALSLWFCPCASSLTSPVVVCCCCCCYYLPWVWSQHIVLELPRFVTSCCLCILIFPCVSFFLFMSVCRIDALHNMMKQCVRRKIKCHGEEIFFFWFSNVLYIFVHYLLPNLVLLTPLVNEPERFGHLL